MTLADYIHALTDMVYPLVGEIRSGYDIYSVNAETIRNYPLLYVMPNGTHEVADDTTTYNVTLFYLDRLTADDANAMDVFCSAIEVLKNVMRHAEDIDGVVGMSTTMQIQNFVETERMADRCAGAYATYQVTLRNDTRCYIQQPTPIVTR